MADTVMIDGLEYELIKDKDGQVIMRLIHNDKVNLNKLHDEKLEKQLEEKKELFNRQGEDEK